MAAARSIPKGVAESRGTVHASRNGSTEKSVVRWKTDRDREPHLQILCDHRAHLPVRVVDRDEQLSCHGCFRNAATGARETSAASSCGKCPTPFSATSVMWGTTFT